MSRGHVTNLLTDFMDEKLAWQPTEKVKAHLAFCNGCRQGLSELKRGITLLRATPVATPSSDLERRIKDWMSVESTHPAEPAWQRPPWLTRGFYRGFFRRKQVRAAAAIVAFLILAVGITRRDGTGAKKITTELGKPVRGGAIAAAAAKASEQKARAEVLPAPLEGSQSAISDAMERVVSTDSAWRELWIRHNANADRVPALPEVNFDKSQVLALFAGEKPTAGYRIQIVSMNEAPWNGAPARMVRYRVQGPQKNAITAQVITQPFLFRVVPRFHGATFFEKNP